MTRRRPAHRLTSALIGAIVAAIGALTMALLSGRDLDTELIAIIALAAVGGWLLITALLAGRRPRSGQWAAQAEPSVYAAGPSTSVPGIVMEDEDDAVADAPHTIADAPVVEEPVLDAPVADAPVADTPPLTAAARKAAARAKRPTTEQVAKADESD